MWLQVIAAVIFEFLPMHKSDTISKCFLVDFEPRNGIKINVFRIKIRCYVYVVYELRLFLFSDASFLQNTNVRTLKTLKTQGESFVLGHSAVYG